MKKLVLGNGKVANILFSSDKKNTIIAPRSECNIIISDEIEKAIHLHNPDIVINCAAKTNLEYCEDNKSDALVTNTLGVMNVLEKCSKFNKKLVHISSGCLFDGNEKVSTEDSNPTPKVWYTWTKKFADDIITGHEYKNTLILRPRQLITRVNHPSNLITKFLRLKNIPAIDEANSITCIEDMIEMLNHLLEKDETGIYNCANTGTVSPLQIALMIKEHLDSTMIVTKISYEQLLKNLPNKRVNTILSVDKLIKSGYTPRPAIEAIEWCLKNYEK